MVNTLTLEIPTPTYELVLKQAKQVGQTPEQIVLVWIEKAVKPLLDDPLLQLAGIFEANVNDISEHHDYYIGQELRNNHE